MTRATSATASEAVAVAMASLLLLVSSGVLVVVVDACDGVPAMGMDDACLKACRSQPLLVLCHRTLLNAPSSAEVTVYAVVAAKMAQFSYESSSAAADQLLQDKSLPSDVRRAYVACKTRYAAARRRMLDAENQLLGCSYAPAKQNLVDAWVDVQACGSELWKFQSSPLFARNADDQSNAALAYELGELVGVGK